MSAPTAPLPYWRVPRRTGERRSQSGAAHQGQILVAAVGDHRRRRHRAGGRTHAGVGSVGQGVEERLLRELVVGAGGGRRGDVVDAQLRADSTHSAEVGGRQGQAMAFGGCVLRRERAVHHAPGWPGAVGHVHLPPTTDLGCVTCGGVVAAGDVWRTAGGRAGAARLGRCVHAGREQKPTVAYLFARRVPRADRAGAGGGYPPGTHRRHRGATAVVVQLAARQTRRHWPGQVARDAGPTGIGQPVPP